MNIPSVFSARTISLFVFILVVLLLDALFDVTIKPESFEEMMEKNKNTQQNNPPTLNGKKSSATSMIDSQQ